VETSTRRLRHAAARAACSPARRAPPPRHCPRCRLCGGGAARTHLRVGGRAGGGGQRELQLAHLLARAQQQPQQRRRAQLLRACAPGAGSRQAQPALACSDAQRDILLHRGTSSSVRSQAGQTPRPACQQGEGLLTAVEWTWHCTERRRSNLIAPGARHALMPAMQRPRASPKAHAHHLRLLHTPAHPSSARGPWHAGRPCRARCGGRRARGPIHVLGGTKGAEKDSAYVLGRAPRKEPASARSDCRYTPSSALSGGASAASSASTLRTPRPGTHSGGNGGAGSRPSSGRRGASACGRPVRFSALRKREAASYRSPNLT